MHTCTDVNFERELHAFSVCRIPYPIQLSCSFYLLLSLARASPFSSVVFLDPSLWSPSIPPVASLYSLATRSQISLSLFRSVSLARSTSQCHLAVSVPPPRPPLYRPHSHPPPPLSLCLDTRTRTDPLYPRATPSSDPLLTSPLSLHRAPLSWHRFLAYPLSAQFATAHRYSAR